jgi:hypothetical protein
MHILFYVIDRINNPKLLHREHKILEYHTHTGNTSNATPRIAYVGKRYIYDTKSEPKGGHHASPVPHDRREHERHYRDKVTGNVIKTVHINSIKVHGGATAAPKQKILKLMGGNEDVF